MPTYQYACTDSTCGNRFELVQSFTDPAVTECPVCAGRVRKVYGSVGVVFKGSGFYRTDSRSSSGEDVKAGAKGESKPDAKSDAKPDSKSKPEPKADAKPKSDSASSSSAPAAAAS